MVIVVTGHDAWSTYLRSMTRRPGWTVARLARESGIARSTVFRWIAEGGNTGITIESVYLVADALGDDRATALRAAGNLPPERDREIDLILGSNRSDVVKCLMIARLQQRRDEEAARRRADLEWMLAQTETPPDVD